MIVAVLMCVYHRDCPDRFRLAVQSILSQVVDSNTHVRVMLGIDGQLPSGLNRIVDEYAPKMHSLVYNEHQIGLGPTLNRLIECLTDEQYVFRMDADDYSCPNRISRQLQFMEANPDIDILGSAITECDARTGRRQVVRFASSPDEARTMICRRVPVAHPTVCFRRRVFDYVPGYPCRSWNEDIAMWFACVRAGLKFSNLDEPLLDFTVDENFFRRRGIRKALSEFACYVQGIYSLWGFNWRLVYPLLRFCMRVSPAPVKRIAYRGPWREGN